MIENRRVRFASIDGIDRLDLPLAAEIWLNDVRVHPWMSSDALKMAALFSRYMSNSDPQQLEFRYIDRSYQLDARQIMQALRLMQIYGFVETFSLEKSAVRVSLNLSLLHRLRVLEARERFSELATKARPELPSFSVPESKKWLPENAKRGAKLTETQDSYCHCG